MGERKVNCEVYTDRGIVGPKGEDGSPNVLSIGTVEGGETASATITGETPNQTLNLVLPKGDKGDEGFSPIATVSKSGSVATISITDKNGTTTTTVNDGEVTTAQLNTALATKQDSLVSGTNIKTVNSTSILGSGNIDIDSLPSQTGQSGKFLTTDGTDASWANVDALPSQTGQNDKFLTTDGTSASWSVIPSDNGKADIDLSNVTGTSGFRKLVEVYNNGSSWYKVYDEYDPTTGAFIGKWCEQGGTSGSFSNHYTTISLLKTYADTNYTLVMISWGWQGTPSEYIVGGTKSTNQFEMRSTTPYPMEGAWRTEGYLAEEE